MDKSGPSGPEGETALGSASPASLAEADRLNREAFRLLDEDRPDEALARFRRLLAHLEETVGENHPKVAATLNNLGLLYATQARYDEAEPLYRRCLELRRKVLGSGHPHVAKVLENYADLLRAAGRDAEADERDRQAESIRAAKDEQG